MTKMFWDLCVDNHIDRKEGEPLYTGKVYAKTMKRDERPMDFLRTEKIPHEQGKKQIDKYLHF